MRAALAAVIEFLARGERRLLAHLPIGILMLLGREREGMARNAVPSDMRHMISCAPLDRELDQINIAGCPRELTKRKPRWIT